MIIRDFIMIIMCFLIMFCQTIGGTTIRYRRFKDEGTYMQYTDFAIIVEALKQELEIQKHIAKFFIPISLIIDLFLLWLKY